jgi:uncharacterized phage protein (TIGR02218 family)
MTTFADLEHSVDSAAPFELYQFRRGANWAVYITTSAGVYNGGSHSYKPVPIERTKLRQGQDTLKDSITLTIPRSHSLASEFLLFSPEESTSVTIIRQHHGLDFSESVVIWKGRVIGAKGSGEKVEINCESIFTSIKRRGLREKTERICQHALYSSGCGVNQPEYRVDDIISGVSGPVITMQSISGFDDGYFNGGILEHLSDSRFIIKHVGNTITLSRPMDLLAVQMEVALYPGCNHTWATCILKFNNVINFKGFPWIPARNPFSQSIK